MSAEMPETTEEAKAKELFHRFYREKGQTSWQSHPSRASFQYRDGLPGMDREDTGITGQQCMGTISSPSPCVDGGPICDYVNKKYFSESLPKLSQILLSSDEKSAPPGLHLQANERFLGYWTLKHLIDFLLRDDPFDPQEQKRFCDAYLSAGFPPHEEEILVALYMRLIGKANES